MDPTTADPSIISDEMVCAMKGYVEAQEYEGIYWWYLEMMKKKWFGFSVPMDA